MSTTRRKNPPSAARCSGPGNRREFLRVGLTGLCGLTLPELLRLRVQAEPQSVGSGSTGLLPARERGALILIWLIGGASHLETYDPKPDAPSDYRGPFAPITTRVPGMDLCELLPRHAALADKFTILRSLVHTGFCHQQGAQQLLTGHPVRELKNQPDHPDLLAITNRVRFDPSRTIPNYVGIRPVPYIGSAYLGPSYEPFAVQGDPNAPEFSVPNIGLTDSSRLDRTSRRIALRQRLDRFVRTVDAGHQMHAFDTFESQAWSLLTSSDARRAFDLSRESDVLRDRYGRNSWGQQCLMARRLIEAGVELVTTTFNGPLAGRVQNWDDHAVNHHCFDVMKARAPAFDQAVTALIDDLHRRGLDRKVMVIVTGEFGRTPKISYSPSSATGLVQPGRDHWPNATSILFSGGGIDAGRVIGATDPRGEQVIERRVGRQDFLQTVYRHLGIEPDGIEFTDFAGRPIPIVSGGRPIPELTARR